MLIQLKAQIEKLTDPSRIWDNAFLAGCQRVECHKCKKSRKYICADCGVALLNEGDKSRLPTVEVTHIATIYFIPKLPFDFVILKDPKEACSKATSSHIRILCPSNSASFSYPVIPDLDRAKVIFYLVKRFIFKTIILFPEQGSLNLGEYKPLASVTKVVLIDATWKMVPRILKDSRLKGIPRLKLSNHESQFWRYQRGNPKSYLSTVEAAYYFCLEQWNTLHTQPYDGRYDNLLFLFDFFLKQLEETKPDSSKDVIAFKRRRVI